MRIYNQRNPKWANYVYSAKPPHTETIKTSGCGICSACMIVSNLSDTVIEPPQMADYSVKNGYRIDGVGTSFGLYTAIAKKYNLKMVQVFDIESAIRCVKNGGLVVCSTNGGTNKLFSTAGHLFVMSGIVGSDVEFVDPDFYEGRYSNSYRKARSYIINGKVYVNKNEAKKHITTYFCYERINKMNKYSYDDTVEKMILKGITDKANMEHWEMCLDGREPLNKDEVRIIFDRLLNKF